MAAPGIGFRRRARDAGAPVLLDEAVSLIQTRPLHWAGLALMPAAPLALASLGFVYLHRVRWLDEAWGAGTTVLSVLVSAAVVAALALRAVGQGRASRAVVRALHPGAKLSEELGVASVAALGLCSAALVVAGLVFGGIPGLLFSSWLLPVLPVAACEGRDPGSALRRLSRLPRGTAGKGLVSVALFSILLLFAWVNVVAGAQVLLYMGRALTGADVTALSRALSPLNGAFLLSSIVISAFLVDGVWCVYRAVLYLDARLGQSGTDLLERWEELVPPTPRRTGIAVGLLLGLLVGPALAQDGEPILGEVLAIEEAAAFGSAEPMEDLSADLRVWRALLQEHIDAYASTGFEDIDSVRAELRWGTQRRVQLPDGRVLRVDGSILADELPEWIHTESTRDAAARFVTRLDRAIGVLSSLEQVEPAGQDPRALLDGELGRGGYDVAERGSEGDAFREGTQGRLRAWVESFLRSLNEYESPDAQRRRGVLPEFDGRWVMAAVAALLAVVLLLFFLGQSKRLRPALPGLDPAGDAGQGALPDARQRSPLGWRAHADRLADEGLFREAIRAQFLAVLSRLDRTGEIDYRQERTNGEHLRSFRGPGPRRGGFARATGTFELAWYGEADVDGGDYATMSSLCDPLVISEQLDARGLPR